LGEGVRGEHGTSRNYGKHFDEHVHLRSRFLITKEKTVERPSLAIAGVRFTPTAD
jgi:hypothetical protein